LTLNPKTRHQVVASAFDLLIIERFNIGWGIDDKTFYMFGDAVIGPAVMMFAFMPAVVLTSKLVPKGLESTTYALLAGFQVRGQKQTNKQTNKHVSAIHTNKHVSAIHAQKIACTYILACDLSNHEIRSVHPCEQTCVEVVDDARVALKSASLVELWGRGEQPDWNLCDASGQDRDV
jgi:hypothetical protein